ncbi:Secretion protein HlyD family protein [Methylocella tundrae]|uniref:Secretion protein HlyD family protein n=1 Tax=Methylocella tundrae TaxID=227605 RepID=A0A8B6MAL6_METTU|nr:HlyD family secretion protein [Methylocella tundrae]VTZ52053.1 Secretion protein HlyD family protein [Methylocella tundrae]
MTVIALLLAFGAAGWFGWRWWTAGRFEETTDNAFLQADKVVATPKVGGFVAEVFVSDNQPVKAGEVLARIDERDYRIALFQSQADLDRSKAGLEGVAAALIQQQAKIEEAKADVATMTAALDFATEEQKRYGDLLHSGAGTIQRSHQATSDLLQKQAALDKARASYDAAQKQTDALHSLEAAARASLQRAEINLDQAKLNLEYTTIRAPIDGVVGDRSLRKGQLVQPGANLLTIVPMGKSIYLIANFKETQVGAMVEGQPASFTVDAYGDHVFHGRIDSFAPGTGAQFALLPPENATGNFTKIVQRVPVKIILDDNDPLIQRLRPGLSVEATIDTRARPGTDHAGAIASRADDERR